MHWTTICSLTLTLLTTTTTTTQALQTRRIFTKFTPNCPSQSQLPGDLNLNEEFTVGMNIRSGLCQGVPVPIPLGYVDEVDHVSVALEVEDSHARILRSSSTMLRAPRGSDPMRENLEVCTARLFERPGCLDTPLIQREFGVGAGVGGESQCVKRHASYSGLAQVFVRVDCVDGAIRTHGPGNGTAGGNFTNGTVAINGTTGSSTLRWRWQQRRLALLGR